jgi:hypothetical protein
VSFFFGENQILSFERKTFVKEQSFENFLNQNHKIFSKVRNRIIDGEEEVAFSFNLILSSNNETKS